MNTPGQQSAAATVDAIDAAVEQRCACGCGSRLDADGPSAWFATEACQRRWNGGRVCEPGADAVITVGTSRGYEAFQQALIDAIAAAYSIGPGQVGTADFGGPSAYPPASFDTSAPDNETGRWAFSLCPEHAAEQAGQPPADPMLAAIEAKRNRNTGPRPRQRAPRRIDPRGSR